MGARWARRAMVTRSKRPSAASSTGVAMTRSPTQLGARMTSPRTWRAALTAGIRPSRRRPGQPCRAVRKAGKPPGGSPGASPKLEYRAARPRHPRGAPRLPYLFTMSQAAVSTPSPVAVKDEFSPFQAMADRFEAAADHLKLDPGVRDVLRTPDREL